MQQEPEPYGFGFPIKDQYFNNYDHETNSDGKSRTGVYRVALPDGRMQIVNYKADDYGYVANVQYEGKPKYDDKPAYKPEDKATAGTVDVKSA